MAVPSSVPPLVWLRDTLRLSGQDTSDIDCWDWKRRISRALHIARVWNADVYTIVAYSSVFLLSAGHTVQGNCFLIEKLERCAESANKCSPDVRCWSHHAFKCHGRLREARCYAAGSQCGACLKHFASNFKLCDHLEHNQVCQATLVTRGALAEVQPGRGSKKFRAGDDVMCPALVADGPTHAPSVSVYFLTESAPEEGILPALEDLFAHQDGCGSVQELLGSAKSHLLQVFPAEVPAKCNCKRLAGSPLLRSLIGVMMLPSNGRLGTLVLLVSYVQLIFVEWLVPDPRQSAPGHSTYRDAAVVLPWLSCDFVHFKPCPPVQQVAVTFCGGGAQCAGLPCS